MDRGLSYLCQMRPRSRRTAPTSLSSGGYRGPLCPLACRRDPKCKPSLSFWSRRSPLDASITIRSGLKESHSWYNRYALRLLPHLEHHGVHPHPHCNQVTLRFSQWLQLQLDPSSLEMPYYLPGITQWPHSHLESFPLLHPSLLLLHFRWDQRDISLLGYLQERSCTT